MTDKDEIQALKDELDHFIRLSQSQAEQIKKYVELQKRSHLLILKLQERINQSTKPSVSFKK